MSGLELFLTLVLYGPVAAFLILIFIPAALGKTFGFRKAYVQTLIYIFEYGRKRIERAHQRKIQAEVNNTNDELSSVSSEDDESEEEKDQDINTGVEVDKRNGYNNKSLRRTVSAVSSEETQSNILQETKRRLSCTSLNRLPSQNSFSRTGDSISEEGKETDFFLSDIFEFVTSGVRAIVNDQVTKRFVTEELKSWNLLTRTNRAYELVSFRLCCLWIIGCIFRYWILLPIRLVIFVVSILSLLILTFFIGMIPNSFTFKNRVHDTITRFSYRLFSRSFSLIATYHQTENKPRSGGICVANHTSIIDIVPLGCETSFALIGQIHGGFLGFLQWILGRGTHHIFFERAEAKDRLAVTRRMKEHVGDPNKLPILIFPEGTCINNSAVMQFKKGSFEVGGVVYPVAIKYDSRFGDAFWNSSEQSMLQYLYMMMTSWAIVCDVWYLPAMTRAEGESSIDFANRVKAAIAGRGGLVDLDWDGQLKRNPAKREWREKEQLKYSQKLANALTK